MEAPSSSLHATRFFELELCFRHIQIHKHVSIREAIADAAAIAHEASEMLRIFWVIWGVADDGLPTDAERIVCLNGEVNDYMSASIVAQLLWLESDTPDKPITMYINSPGGSVTSGMAIYDTMTYIKSPVSTVCVGGAASMAAVLLAGGEAGKRYALPHSSIMIHQPLGGTRGQASDIMIYANQIQKIREQSNKIMRYHLNKAKGDNKYTLDEVNEMMERDKYLSAEEALELGVIDEILVKRTEADAKEENKGQSPGTPS
ncbi:ATP-dependent Clp protease proteolytic subunit [Beauveria bassiana]|uniref:ATP-dependent Clp protease proteolytic subunit n=1 Tax=Beauveria bassiana TaxID=176275 RepID=A0A2N6NHP0_BEABA|nr:ATP-dependent Clp protease proteolytic subunit [Beauveria bassiana]